MSANPNLKRLQQEIEKCKARIAAERDKLRVLLDEAEAIADCADEAIGSLEHAVDTLSQYL